MEGTYGTLPISEEDRMIWSLFKNHSFFVNTYYKALRKRKERGGSASELHTLCGNL